MTSVLPRRMALIGATAALVVSSIAVAGAQAAPVEPPTVKDAQKVLSHFLCYRGRKMGGFRDFGSGPTIGIGSALTNANATVGAGYEFCNPVQKKKGRRVKARIVSRRQHLKRYVVSAPFVPHSFFREISNQLGAVQDVQMAGSPSSILVPSRQFPRKFPSGLDHYACHATIGGRPGTTFKLTDRFKRYKKMRVGSIQRVCVPFWKIHGEKTIPARHPGILLACYNVSRRDVRFERIASNQFEKRKRFKARKTMSLCVPSIFTPA